MDLEKFTKQYLKYCKEQKCLDTKTLKAYFTDLNQFSCYFTSASISPVIIENLENYISYLHQQYKPRTAKRKIASLKAFFHYLEYKDIIEKNPFNKMNTKFREPVVLPKAIPLHIVKTLFSAVYKKKNSAKTPYQRKNAVRDAAVIELLFATGIRISELCSLQSGDVDLKEHTILIHGKGSKERILQIGNQKVIKILSEYKKEYINEINCTGYFFVNQPGRVLSDQTVRRMINKYSSDAAINLHITPHMFRHTFATSLLDADVDIRYIQEMLGHSSINTTEIYTHVSLSKQKDILTKKNPRNNLNL